MTRTRSILTATGCIVGAGAFGLLAGVNPANGASVPNCGGQSAAEHPVPYDCVSQKTIDGTTFTASVHADGSHVTVVITLNAPRADDTSARIIHHEGNSGAGGQENTSSGVIPAGATSITLVDSAPCRVGQLDIKAVFTGNGDERGRVGGPWIRNGTDCMGTTTVVTTPTTSPVTTSPTSSPITIPRSGSSSPTTPATVSVPHGTVAGNLPATGGNLTGFYIGAGGIALGVGLLVITRRRATS
jgi:LPXTG-motif cell wall-anchored protein